MLDFSDPWRRKRSVIFAAHYVFGETMKENVAIDLGKRASYIVVERDDKIVKEGYAPTTKEGFDEYLGPLTRPTVIFESSCTVDRAVSILHDYDCKMKVVHPMKLKVIAESMKKTDKNDAHIMLQLNKVGYLPESYLPTKKIRKRRNLCRTRAFFVRNRTTVKCRIRDQAYRSGIEFKNFTKKTTKALARSSPIFEVMTNQLNSLNLEINRLDKLISDEVKKDRYAQLLDTIPGVGEYGALCLSSEIGDIDRFPSESNIFAYAGLVPRIHQSGDKEWKGHITRGNSIMKWILVECVQIHINTCPDSTITLSFEDLRNRIGRKKAVIAAARRLLRLVYYMLKRNMDYGSYEIRAGRRVGFTTAALQRPLE